MRYLAFILLFVNLFCSTVSGLDKRIDEPIKVGIYEDTPYITINSNNEITGYYIEFLELIKKEGNIDYELVVSDFSDLLTQLENGNIDILMGLDSTGDRQENFLFNNYKVSFETHTINTNKNINYGDFSKLEGMTIGLIEDCASSNCVLSFLENKEIRNLTPIYAKSFHELENLLKNGSIDIMVGSSASASSNCVLSFLENKEIRNLTPIYAKSFHELENLLKNGSIDIMVGSSARPTKYKSIYNFESHPVYIGANKNNLHIINYIDNQIEKMSLRENNLIVSLYDKYFHPEHRIQKVKSNILFFLLTILIILFYFLFIKSKIKKFKTQKKIRYEMANDKYLIYYQPILNPHTNKIIGFEGLLRLLVDDNKVLSPYHFIKEIEDNDMLFEVSLWILQRIIKAYPLISNHINNENNLYISMNLSLNEIRDENFVNSAIEILSKSNIGPNKICLEIVENVKIDKLDVLTASIKKLKDAGFKIAIDDFGIEYSNLDVLKKLDFDIVKLDKYFVDDLYSCEIKQEVIRFVSKIATVTNRSLVIEGVEEEYQLDLIKSIENSKLYIQGYFYSKPLTLEEILNT